MAWFSNSLLNVIFQRIWRGLFSTGRFITRIFFRYFGSGPPALQDENGVNASENVTLEEVVVVHSPCEVQEPVRVVTVSMPEFACQRPLADEEEDEEKYDEEEYRVSATDELYCEYDSTWETELSQEVLSGIKTVQRSTNFKLNIFLNAARDMQNYRHGYPFKTRGQHNPNSEDMPNLNFYLGKTPSLPDGVYIGDFHTAWYGRYDSLEYVHTFIQWLFPLEEPGMNREARTLTKAEIERFLEEPIAKENLLKSYKLMLDFYGIELCNEETGQVRRASNWRDRFESLNRHTHNYLRITRILKCLGTLGYRHYQAPLVAFFLNETLVERELQNVKDSVLNYFVFSVLSRSERRKLIKFAYLNYDQKDKFVWCPQKIQAIWSTN
ncbi:opioid growth factor receptor-like protein 1 isoform X2 [Festucalex cinctus]